MEKEIISVIIVNWNGKKWLKKCLDSLLNQTYKNLEIIVVDNASTDGSVNFIKWNYKSVKLLLNKTNLGYSTAVNKGIDKSEGSLLLLINNDTWVDKNLINNLFKFYSENKYSVISPSEKRYDGRQDFVQNTTIDPTGTPSFYPKVRKDKIFYTSVCYFCSKKEYRETLGFDDDFFLYFEDVDWFWRLNILGKKFVYVPEIYIYHSGSASGGEGFRYQNFLWRNQNTLTSLLKNYSAASLSIILPLFFLQNLIEIVFFLILGKADIAKSYIESWSSNFKNLNKTLKKRAWIQKKRAISDLEILRKMYFGWGKLLHFQRLFLNKNVK